MSTPLIVDARPKGVYVSTVCPWCKTDIEYIKPKLSVPPPAAPSSSPSSATLFQIRCCQCQKTWNGPVPKAKAKTGTRTIGSDEKPLETEYYDLLGIGIQATDQEIKTSYRRLVRLELSMNKTWKPFAEVSFQAIKHHPDKNPNDPLAEEKFKKIAVAYSTLSDKETRHKYNEFGAAGGKGGEEGVVDPEAVFSSLFGGERFQDIIGTISLGQEMKAAMQEDGEEEEEEYEEDVSQAQVSKVSQSPTASAGSTSTTVQRKKKKKELTPEQKARKAEVERKLSAERAKVREERVGKLEQTLKRKLAIYTEQVQQGHVAEVVKSVRAIWTIEAHELKDESYGVELLNVVGATYCAKARHHQAASGTPFGIGGWWHGAKSTAHVLGETYSTVRSALELKSVFEELQNAENNGLSEEKRKELEEKAATKGLAALFKGAKLEVESVIREVCDRILSEKGFSETQLERRADGLQILGEVYLSIKKEGEKSSDDSEYVKVEKK